MTSRKRKHWRDEGALDRHLYDLLLRCSVRGFIYFFIFWPNSLVTVVEADWQVVAGVLHLCSPSLPLCVLVRLLLCCEIRNVTKNKACWLTRMMTFAYLKGKPGPPKIHSYVLGDKPTCSQNKCPHSWKPGIKSKSQVSSCLSPVMQSCDQFNLDGRRHRAAVVCSQFWTVTISLHVLQITFLQIL